MAAIIEAWDLVKEFEGFRAANNISFAVEEGVVVGFLAPMGQGKLRPSSC
jgi:ABC-type multidrug transport system ATPase subunit